MNDVTIQVTQSGYQDLQKELEQLFADRPAVVKEMNHMRSLGDLKENAAYELQKNKLAFLDGRIQEVEHLIKNAQIIEKTEDGIAGIGNTVVLHIEGDEVTYQLVSETEADIEKGRISTNSPIGSALVGKQIGDFIAVETPGGKITYEILHID